MRQGAPAARRPGQPGERDGRGGRFHVLAGNLCNNNCLFCMEHEREGGDFRGLDVSAARVRELLAEGAGSEEVMFTSGEPTLNPELPEMLRRARELGFRRIGLTTNGRRLSYERYARLLLRSGLNHLVVSVHGPDARSHDAQTRSPGSFEQTAAGLAVLSRLRREHRFTLHTSTVVGTRNVRRLGEVLEFLRPFGVDQVVLNVMQPLGRAARLGRKVVAPYSEVVREVSALLRRLGDPPPPLYLVDVPACASEGLPAAVRGYVECAWFTEPLADGSRSLRETRIHKEAVNRVKRAECAGCRYDAGCLGPWRNYVALYGWDELVPVPPG